MGLQPKSVLQRQSYGAAIGYNVAGPLARNSLRTRFEKMWVMERQDRCTAILRTLPRSFIAGPTVVPGRFS